jgi:phospholipid/cholesterol/gamma-HCH transport system substrate-binding protein
VKNEERNYVVVGGFVLAVLAGLILWIALVSGRTGRTDPYYVLYENVMGLSDGTQIYYQGYPVGLIESITRVDDGEKPHFRIDLTIRRGWRIPDDSIAEISASGLLSAVVIDIREGQSTTPLEPGSQIPSREQVSVFAVLSSVADSATDLLDNSIKPMAIRLADGSEPIVENLEDFTDGLKQAVDQINEMLSPLNTRRVGTILENMESVSREVAALTADLGKTRSQLDRVIRSVETIIADNEDELSAGMVDLHHTLEAISRHNDAITHNLEVTTRNANEFSRQIREDPSVVIRGRSQGDGAGSN